MNFNDVRNAPEKQWVDGVAITVKSFGEEPNDKFNQFIQGVVGIDAAGEECAFKIATQYEDTLLVSSEISQTLPFRLKWFNSRAGAQMQGYCTKPKKLRATPQTSVQRTIQDEGHPDVPQPQTARRAPQASRQQAPDWDAKDERIVRQNTLNRAVDIYRATHRGIFSNSTSPAPWPISQADEEKILQQAERFRDYVYNGLEMSPVAQAPRQTFKEAVRDVEEYRDSNVRPATDEESYGGANEQPPF